MINMEELEQKRHTLAHVLAMAVREFYPDVKLGIGPTTDNGFYYDIEFSSPIADEDLPKIEKRMRELVNKKLEMSGQKVSADEAREIFVNEPYKLELINEYDAEGRELTVYEIGGFTDLCKGGHVDNTQIIDTRAFTLTHVAGAYWRGDSTNPMLTRVYGLAFNTKQELNEYKKRIEEAKKYDHRKLGREMDLFTFSELVGSGLPLFTPKGTLVRDLIDGYIWDMRRRAGYERVDIPHITKKELYQKSGHWDKFSDDLFHVSTREGHDFVLKPMNCPHHTQIYARHPHSYRDLPVRYANTTKVYRDEQTGELGGLTRVRSITQDDAHVFCRKDQVTEEMGTIFNIIEKFYGRFGFTLVPRLSLHDPATPEKFLGSQDTWQKAEASLREIITSRKYELIEAIGEAAFYGPKIDFMATDSLGREWQVATIQLDMNLPERFELSCVNEDGEDERIVMIHAAITGSLERFLGVVLEHLKGELPFWLAPTQVRILTVNDGVMKYAADIANELEEYGLRVTVDDRNESIGKKVRESELNKIPYAFVIGEKEAEGKMVSVRAHGKQGDLGTMSIASFVETIKEL